MTSSGVFVQRKFVEFRLQNPGERFLKTKVGLEALTICEVVSAVAQMGRFILAMEILWKKYI